MAKGGISFSAAEMKAAGVGKYIENRTAEWDKKKRIYEKERVWDYFDGSRTQYRRQFTDETGWVDNDLANRTAQKETDILLLRRARGEVVVMPDQSVDEAVEETKAGVDGLYDRSRFEHCEKNVSPLEVIDYVFNNIDIRDPRPEDAPSPGAFFYLKHVQMGSENRQDFYKTMYSKTVPSKSLIEDARKRNDDGRSNLDLLETLTAEMGHDADGDAEVPLLCVAIEDEPGDQDPQGERGLPETTTP